MYIFCSLLFSSPIFSCTRSAKASHAISTIQGEHHPCHPSVYLPHSSSHFSVPLSVGLFGVILRGVQILPSAHWPILPQLSRPLFAKLTSPELLPLWGRNAKKFMASTQQTCIRRMSSRKCWSYFWNLWSFCKCLAHAEAHPSLRARKVNFGREQRKLFYLRLVAILAGTAEEWTTLVSEIFPAKLGWLWK